MKNMLVPSIIIADSRHFKKNCREFYTILMFAGCNSCAAGWIKDNEKGCVDVNECAASLPVCSSQQFCVNTEGSYKCLECDRACAGCTGDGPDMCIRCASGYFLKEGICNGNLNTIYNSAG